MNACGSPKGKRCSSWQRRASLHMFGVLDATRTLSHRQRKVCPHFHSTTRGSMTNGLKLKQMQTCQHGWRKMCANSSTTHVQRPAPPPQPPLPLRRPQPQFQKSYFLHLTVRPRHTETTGAVGGDRIAVWCPGRRAPLARGTSTMTCLCVD